MATQARSTRRRPLACQVEHFDQACNAVDWYLQSGCGPAGGWVVLARQLTKVFERNIRADPAVTDIAEPSARPDWYARQQQRSIAGSDEIRPSLGHRPRLGDAGFGPGRAYRVDHASRPVDFPAGDGANGRVWPKSAGTGENNDGIVCLCRTGRLTGWLGAGPLGRSDITGQEGCRNQAYEKWRQNHHMFHVKSPSLAP